MFAANCIYGLDIETDNSQGHGLTPSKSAITQIAVVSATEEVVFEGDEQDILLNTHRWLSRQHPGLLVTWNGTFFDLPFISDRARTYGTGLDVVLDSLVLAPQEGLVPKYDFLPGHTAGYAAWWAGHTHLDVTQAWKQFAQDQEVSWSLKPVLRAAGFDPVELDRTRLHEYTPDEVKAYVTSDARGARDLALRTLGLN